MVDRASNIRYAKALCSVLFWLVTSILSSAGSDDPSAVFTTYQTVKVADNVYAFIAPYSKTGFVSGNSVAIIGDDGILVVDSGHVPSLTKRMIADIRHVSNKPIRFLVNTHWHPDHNSGNSQYKEAFPDITIISTVATGQQFEKALPLYDDPDAFAAQMIRVREALRTGKRSNGIPLTDAEREYYTESVAEADTILPEMRMARHTPPTLQFEKELKIQLGKREVQVLFLGRGNTAGDAVIYVPDAKLVMTGDLLVNPTPYAFGSFFSEWIGTMKRLRSLDAEVIVPGHGGVENNKDYMDLVIALLESTTSQVNAAVKEGLSLEDTRKKIDLTDFQNKFAGHDADRIMAFQQFFVIPGIERAYKEAKSGSPLTIEE
jgi:glyoxylase-like metal-dependent hydrolase (beta-lactamase superfamily II)